ncbi:hypothetical protein BC936DRAFT_147367 [Jimgerdemannia flammicorona]|uniref:Uncharacterized protein n=2 Tax=Jimgerdemannia flammicorona TaxID=994334 RepID=A0A433D5M6_9FUNG|nr:hypothetical protein BC936DRAFT_147367 [Jimgerdemannia flammicorona]RUS23908.1 hypothetical protein BC938DRAFT_474431 [Jimgerdemannia flammicorona]
MAPQLWRTLSFASVASATTRTCTRTTVSSIYRMHPHTLPSARHHFTTPSTSSLTATSLDPPLSKPTTLGGTFRRRRYLGYFLEYMLWIILGSEALHLVWLKIDRREYAERTTFKVEVLRDVVRRLEAGDDIAADEVLKGDVKRLLLRREGAEVVDDSYFEKCEWDGYGI